MRSSCWLALFCLPLVSPADDRIVIDARINQHDVQLGFDTGFGDTFLVWSNVASRLGLTMEGPPVDFKPGPGDVPAGRTEPVTLEIDGHTLPGVRLRTLDPPSSLPWDVHGLVGWQAIKQNIVVFRVAEKLFTFAPAVPPEAATWFTLPVLQDRSVLVLALTKTNGQPPGGVLIDTGMEKGVSLSAKRWREWRGQHRNTPVTLAAYFTPGAGLVIREECWADELKLEGLTLYGVTVSEANGYEPKLVGADYSATIGLAALRRLDLVVDASNGVAYAKSRRESPTEIPHNRLGALFAPMNGKGDDLVARVIPRSPAAAAGIRDGDVLLKIDELDVTAWRTQPGITPLGRFWAQPAGTVLQLTLRRGTQVSARTIELKNILGPK